MPVTACCADAEPMPFGATATPRKLKLRFFNANPVCTSGEITTLNLTWLSRMTGDLGGGCSRFFNSEMRTVNLYMLQHTNANCKASSARPQAAHLYHPNCKRDNPKQLCCAVVVSSCKSQSQITPFAGRVLEALGHQLSIHGVKLLAPQAVQVAITHWV